MSRYRGAGYAGLIGTSLALFAFLSAIWGVNDPTLNFTWWLVYLAIFGASLAFAAAIGFRLMSKRGGIMQDFTAAIFGIGSAALIIGLNLIIAFIDPAFSYVSADSVWLVVIAPVTETLIFDVVIYDIADFYAQGVDWKQVAIASDITFVGNHYFKYFAQTQLIAPVLIIIILGVGNTLFIYGYSIYKNATAPMISHTMVNIASAKQQVLQSIINAVPWLMATLIIIIVAFFLSKLFLGRSSS